MDPIETLPSKVKTFIGTDRPRLKDQPPDPEDFYGREVEIATLMKAIQTVTTGQTGTGHASAEVVAAAPGAGKTSLIDALDRRLRAEGIGHIRLDPKHLTSPKAFSDAVKRQPPYCYFARGEMILEKSTNTVTVVTDAVLHIATNILTKVTTLGLGKAPNVKLAKKVIKQWRKGKTPDPRDVVQGINTMWRAGTVITIDEAQDLAECAAKGRAKDCATDIIGLLASEDPRQQADIDRAMICFFGLADTPIAVHELGSPTVNTTVLAPLHRDYVRMMINGAIDKATKGQPELAQWAKDAWTELLTEEFGDWTRHAQAATQAAYELLQRFGAELQSAEWATRAVRALANRHKQSTYDAIRVRAAARGVTTWMRDIAVQALWCNGNKVHQGKMDELLNRYIRDKRPKIEAKEIETLREQATRRLMRSGIMDRTDFLPHDKHRVAYYAPIPSLLQNLSGDEVTEPSRLRTLLDDEGLNSDPDHRPEETFQPKWEQWTPEEAATLAPPGNK